MVESGDAWHQVPGGAALTAKAIYIYIHTWDIRIVSRRAPRLEGKLQYLQACVGHVSVSGCSCFRPVPQSNNVWSRLADLSLRRKAVLIESRSEHNTHHTPDV